MGCEMINCKKGKCYYVKWVDSYGSADGWENRDYMYQIIPSVIKTVGFATDVADDYITLAMSVSPKSVMDRLSIPICSIKSIKEIRL